MIRIEEIITLRCKKCGREKGPFIDWTRNGYAKCQCCGRTIIAEYKSDRYNADR